MTTTNRNSQALASQILTFIKKAKYEQGHHLKEQELVELLGVSRTPVRHALEYLCEHEVVEKRKNKGFFLNRSHIDLQLIKMEKPVEIEDELYSRLVKDRLNGVLPEVLHQIEIADTYHVARGALLKTLNKMAEDGLIARNKGHGWKFLPSINSDDTLYNGYSYRYIIEPAAIMMKGYKPNLNQIESCRLQHLYIINHPNIETISSAQLFNTDAHFHELVASFSHNSFILQAIQQQNRLRKLLEFSGYNDHRRIKHWCHEHLNILDMLAKGDYLKASSLMKEHLEHAVLSAEDHANRRKKAK